MILNYQIRRASFVWFVTFDSYDHSGESGAGKTENTKKVIGYFAEVAASNAGGQRVTFASGVSPCTSHLSV